MSAKLMGQVWELDLNHGEQAIMLALADHGEDDGSQIFPSVARLAWKTGYKERQVQNILRALEDKSLIIPVAHVRGGRGKATEYQMCIENGAKKPPFKPEKRAQSVANDETEKGAKQETVQSVPERVQSKTKRVQKSEEKGAIVIAPQPSSLTINREPSCNHHLGASAPTTQPTGTPSSDALTETEPTRTEETTTTPSKPSAVEWDDIAAARASCGAAITTQQEQVGAWASVMGLDVGIPANAKRVGNMLIGLRKSKECQPTREVAELRFSRTPPADGSWNYYTHTWQGSKGQFPTEREINQYWGQWNTPTLQVVKPARAAPRPDEPDGIDAFLAQVGRPPDSNIIEGRVIHGRTA